MHWCVYPSPTRSLIQASKTESKTAKQYQQTPLTSMYLYYYYYYFYNNNNNESCLM